MMLPFTHSCMPTYIHYWRRGEKTKASLLHAGYFQEEVTKITGGSYLDGTSGLWVLGL